MVKSFKTKTTSNPKFYTCIILSYGKILLVKILCTQYLKPLGRYNCMGSNQQCEPSTNLRMYTVDHISLIISSSSKYNKISSYKEVVVQTVLSLTQFLLWFKCVRDRTVILSLDRRISPEGGIKIQKIISPVETWKNSHSELYTDFLLTGLYFLLFGFKQ